MHKALSPFLQNVLRKLVLFFKHQSPPTPARKERYPNFDLFRLLLAVEVAFVHMWAQIDPNFGWPGFVMAVPAFLAISGFLVLQSYSESGCWRVFITKRILRIVPALLVSFLLCLILFGLDMVKESFFVWISGGLYPASGPANGPLWSLAWEELAYLGLAILWLFGAYKRPFFIWILWFLSIGLVWFSASRLVHNQLIIIFLGPAFFRGNLMFIYRKYLLAVPSFVPWIAFYIMLQWRFVPHAQLFGGASLLLVQTFTVVWAGMAGARILSLRIPDISYGVYIYHFPIIMFIVRKFNPISLSDLILLTSAALIPVSLASWYLVEKPILRLKLANVRE